MSAAALPYSQELAMLATMCGKERVIAPLLERYLGLRVKVSSGIDSDRFGTFSRDVERTGSPLDAARAKIAAVLAPEAQVALASEGFGPHPHIPFPFGQPAPARALIKDVSSHTDLEKAVTQVIAIYGVAFVETDMRAHRNPTRMRAIKAATVDPRTEDM